MAMLQREKHEFPELGCSQSQRRLRQCISPLANIATSASVALKRKACSGHLRSTIAAACSVILRNLLSGNRATIVLARATARLRVASSARSMRSDSARSSPFPALFARLPRSRSTRATLSHLVSVSNGARSPSRQTRTTLVRSVSHSASLSVESNPLRAIANLATKVSETRRLAYAESECSDLSHPA